MTGRSDFETEFPFILAILVLVSNKMHYDNMQRGVDTIYCDFNGCKSGNFQLKIVIFLKFCSKYRSWVRSSLHPKGHRYRPTYHARIAVHVPYHICVNL